MKKYLILFFSILIFASCTRMAINTANSKATKNQFYQGWQFCEKRHRE